MIAAARVGGLSSARPDYRHLMPAPEDFPGSPAEPAERVCETVRFSRHPTDFAPLRLHYPPGNRKSTGLYRVAGEIVIVTVQAESAMSTVMPRLRIGAHQPSRTEHNSRYQAGCFSLHEGSQRKGGWRAGLIYLESQTTGTDSFEVTIDGAVRAPWFKLGRDSVPQWQETLRRAPAPWAELEGDRAILTLPSAMIRDLDDPVPLIRFYDRLVQDACRMVGLREDADDERDRSPDLPFRFVLRRPVARRPRMAAFAGFPVSLNWTWHGDPFVWLTPEDPRVRSVLLHELGHTLEPEDKLFEPPGAQEAFADLIDYGWQSQQGYQALGTRGRWPRMQRDYDYAYHPGRTAPLMCVRRWLRCRFSLQIWARRRGVSLTRKRAFMITLVRHLSHEFIAALWHRFRHTPREALPDRNNQQQKTDWFFERLCEVTQQDLTRFFRSWRVPVSSRAYARVADKRYEVPAWAVS